MSVTGVARGLSTWDLWFVGDVPRTDIETDIQSPRRRAREAWGLVGLQVETADQVHIGRSLMPSWAAAGESECGGPAVTRWCLTQDR